MSATGGTEVCRSAGLPWIAAVAFSVWTCGGCANVQEGAAIARSQDLAACAGEPATSRQGGCGAAGRDCAAGMCGSEPCGIVAVLTLCSALQKPADRETVVKSLKLGKNEEASLLDLQQALSDIGIKTIGVSASCEELSKLTPAIVHMKDHFEVVVEVKENVVLLASRETRFTMPKDQFLQKWTGATLAEESRVRKMAQADLVKGKP